MVEFALTASLLFMFFMASLDFARANLLRHTINNAAFEGARIGIIPGATAADCIAESNRLLAMGFVTSATVTVTPSTIEDDTEAISVTVTVPLAENLWAASVFFGTSEMSRTSTIVRETY